MTSTDFRALCEELTTTLEYTWDGRRPKVIQELIERARAVLACYGTPANEPVPVSERLPLHLAGELDDQGTCWNYHPINLHCCLCVTDPSIHTHWLPANVLPTPEAND